MTMLPKAHRPSRWTSRALAVAGCAVAATLVYADCRIAANAGDKAQTAVVAEFTGEVVRGAPVYRLPPIIVSGKRSAFALETPQNRRDAAVDDTHRAQVVRARSPS
jgi:hypothetical protein